MASRAAGAPPNVRRWALLFAAAAFFVDILLAWNTYGTNDVDMWRASAALAHGETPIELYQHLVAVKQINNSVYNETFNHPPLVLFLLGKFAHVPSALNIPFHTLFRLMSSVASLATFLLVYRLTASRVASQWNLLFYAFCPVCILVAGFHGNSDPWMILFLVATVWSVERGQEPWLSGLFFSLALNTKLVPLFLIPALFFRLRGRERIIFFGTIAGVCVAIWLPYLIQDPKAVLKSTFGYGGEFAIWGFGYLLRKTIFIWKYSFNAKYIILALSVLLAWCMNRPASRIPLFDQFGITLFLFLFLTPGFGVQYMYWLAPWAIVLGTRPYLLHWAVSGMFLFTTYNWWCRGMPWWYADSISTVQFNFAAQVLCILSWITVGLVLYAYYRCYPAVFHLAWSVIRNPRAELQAAYKAND